MHLPPLGDSRPGRRLGRTPVQKQGLSTSQRAPRGRGGRGAERGVRKPEVVHRFLPFELREAVEVEGMALGVAALEGELPRGVELVDRVAHLREDRELLDEGLDLDLKVSLQIVVLQQDAVLQGLMPALDLALGLGVVGSATDVLHVTVIEPFGQVLVI